MATRQISELPSTNTSNNTDLLMTRQGSQDRSVDVETVRNIGTEDGESLGVGGYGVGGDAININSLFASNNADLITRNGLYNVNGASNVPIAEGELLHRQTDDNNATQDVIGENRTWYYRKKIDGTWDSSWTLVVGEPKTLSGSTTNSNDTTGHTHSITTSDAIDQSSTSQIANSKAVKDSQDRVTPKTLSGGTSNTKDSSGHTHNISTSNSTSSSSTTTLATSKAVNDLRTTVPYQNESRGISLGGGFPSAATIDVVRVGEMVTVTLDNNGTDLTSGAVSPDNTLPSWAIPSGQTINNVYKINSSSLYMIAVLESGRVAVNIYNYDGSINSSSTNYGRASISYLVS